MFWVTSRRWLNFTLVGALSFVASATPLAQAHDSASGTVAEATTSDIPSATLDFLPSSSINTGAVPLPAVVHTLDVPLNQRVLSYIELFQGRLHDFIDGGLKRGSQYLPM